MNSQPCLLPGGMRANTSELQQLSCCHLSGLIPSRSASLLNPTFPAARFAATWEQVEEDAGAFEEWRKPHRATASQTTSLLPACVSPTAPINQRAGLRPRRGGWMVSFPPKRPITWAAPKARWHLGTRGTMKLLLGCFIPCQSTAHPPGDSGEVLIPKQKLSLGQLISLSHLSNIFPGLPQLNPDFLPCCPQDLPSLHGPGCILPKKNPQICPKKCPRKLPAGRDISRDAGTSTNSGPLKTSCIWGQLILLPAKELAVVNGFIPPAQHLGAI